ncbi:hypothetical protein T265_10776 [Opisthorchis viverrini]|uniref:Reverse transcriptase domain-containing protein n=1 Tax=Opisthorchis viverrini TaxID=6198 RepID=A0A074Z137_OPIVI|nr:hypothetical protein T265_10776 [Opisthorchis viverrini]KER20756.1 hypothetical protein T265_10776 [Opisthorchis viverrini]
MGSPISGLIAEIAMQKLERIVLPDIKPQIWVRYVEDTFAVVRENELLRAEELLNNVFPDIQFTMETEENNNLASLDGFATGFMGEEEKYSHDPKSMNQDNT